VDIQQVKDIINVLPHVGNNRVPYTYHHDYLRAHSPRFKNASRSEVALATSLTLEDERSWATCLAFIVDEMSARDVFALDSYTAATLEALLDEADKLVQVYLAELNA
jgi:hypothetical protein